MEDIILTKDILNKMENQKLTIFKKQTLNYIELKNVKEYYENQSANILYFPYDRTLTITQKEIDQVEISDKLKGTNFKKDLEYSFDMSDPFIFEGKTYGDRISSGYMQLMNLMLNIYLNESNNIILIVEHLEQNYHILVFRYLLNVLYSIKKIKKIIISTWTEDDIILNNFKKNIINL